MDVMDQLGFAVAANWLCGLMAPRPPLSASVSPSRGSEAADNKSQKVGKKSSR